MTTDIVVGTSMKVTCAKGELSEQLAIAGRGLSMRPTVQIFAGVLMQANAGRLHIRPLRHGRFPPDGERPLIVIEQVDAGRLRTADPDARFGNRLQQTLKRRGALHRPRDVEQPIGSQLQPVGIARHLAATPIRC